MDEDTGWGHQGQRSMESATPVATESTIERLREMERIKEKGMIAIDLFHRDRTS